MTTKTAAAAAASSHLAPATSPQPKTICRPTFFMGGHQAGHQVAAVLAERKWRVVDKHNKSVPPAELLKAVAEHGITLSEGEWAVLDKIQTANQSMTLNQCLKEFVGPQEHVNGGDTPLFDPDCPREVTLEGMTAFLERGTDPKRREEWIAYIDNYMVLNTTSALGPKAVTEYLHAEFDQAPDDMWFEPGPMCIMGSLVMVLIFNHVGDQMFPLVSIDVIDPKTKRVALNIDFYNRFRAILMIMEHLLKNPKIAAQVMEKVIHSNYEMIKDIFERVTQCRSATVDVFK